MKVHRRAVALALALGCTAAAEGKLRGRRRDRDRSPSSPASTSVTRDAADADADAAAFDAIDLANDLTGDRSLMEMDTYSPLMCNVNAAPSIASATCLDSATPLSALIDPTGNSNVVVPCGQCVTVDYTDGSTVTLPGDGSLSIKGRLHFPSDSNVVINATAVFVEGMLDIPHGIEEGREVKVTLYGNDEWYYYPHMMCTYGDVNCMHRKGVGKKPVVVAGGTVDIRNSDPSCPSWTTLKDVATVGPSPKNGLPLTKGFVLDQSFANCVRVDDVVMVTSNTYGGWDEHFEFKVESVDAASGTVYMTGSTDKSFATEVSSSVDNTDEEHLFPSEVALLDRNVVFEGQRQLIKETYPIKRESDVLDLSWKSSFVSSVSTVDVTETDVSAGFLQFAKSSGIGSVDVTYSSSTKATWQVGRVANCNVHLKKNGVTVHALPAGNHVVRTYSVDVIAGDVLSLTQDNCMAALLSIEHETRVRDVDPTDPEDIHAAHFMVFHTPDVVQTIEGVRFDNMGQAGRLGRYPLHFHMCGDATGSVVRKNVVTNSLQRCYVIHGTHGVMVEDNVAYKTRGHCYVTEDGTEINNSFVHNLGAQTMDLGADNGQSDSNENGSVTFWIRNIKNHWIENVAAGAKAVGYWFDMPKKYFVLNPLYTFRNNAAHSSATGISMYPGMGLTVANTDTAVLDGLRVWNNHMVGLIIFFSGGFKITNSLVVNNKVGIQDTHGHQKEILIKDTRIIGSLSNNQIESGLYYTYNNAPLGSGRAEIVKPALQNVTFSSFTGNSKAIKPYAELFLETSRVMGQPIAAVDAVFDATVYGGSRNPMPDAAELPFPWTMYVEDPSGTFSPTGNPGFWVKNTPRLTHFIPQACSAVDSQSVFCENACIQHFIITPANYHLGIYKKMRLTDGAKSFDYLPVDSYNGQTFDVLLPPGTYTATFLDAGNNAVVPPNIAIDKKRAPTRAGCSAALPSISFSTATFRPTQAPTNPPFVNVDPDILDSIPETADFHLAYELDIPSNPAYQAGPPDYSVDNHDGMTGFSRVAYYLELDGDYVWVSMDAFTTDASKIGVPCLSLACGDGMNPTVFQQSLTNVNVVSNVPGLSGTGLGGNIEFWPYSYSQGSDSAFDQNDVNSGTGNFGSMQIHLLGKTVFAFNRFNIGSVADLGIGNSVIGLGSDWSLAENADSYQTKILKVFTNAQVSVTTTTPTTTPTTTATTTTAPTTTTTTTVTATPTPTEAVTPPPTNALPTPPSPPTGTLAVPNIPDSEGYQLVYDLAIPSNPAYGSAAPQYSVNNSQTTSGFSRIAYYLELGSQYVWVSMDAFTDDARKIGVPCKSLACGDGVSPSLIQTIVTNVNVVSNVAGLDGSGYTGNIEFFPFNFSPGNGIGIPGASGSLFDWGDTADLTGSYGSMQVHVHGGGSHVGTVFSFNRFNDGATADLGIGNNPSGQPDWVLAGNAGTFPVKNLRVYVDGASAPAPVTLSPTNLPTPMPTGTATNEPTPPPTVALTPPPTEAVTPPPTEAVTPPPTNVPTNPPTPLPTGSPTDLPTPPPTEPPVPSPPTGTLAVPNIPDSEGYELVYDLAIPSNPAYGSAAPQYSVNNSQSTSGFSRIAYYLELGSQYVWVSMDAFTNDARKIGVPCKSLACGDGVFPSLIQTIVTNVNVVSNVAGLSGSGYNGNIEFFPFNFSPGNGIGIPGASSSTFDFGDTADTAGSYGSMQVHVHDGGSHTGTVFSFNRFNDGATADLGIGNNPSGQPDWVLASNAHTYSVRNLKVFVSGAQAPPPVDPYLSGKNIPDAAGFELVYALDIPTNPNYGAAPPNYSVNNSNSVSTFSRVAYYLELSNYWVWVSFDKPTSDAKQLGVPCLNLGCGNGIFPTLMQKVVTNMNVASSIGMLNFSGRDGNIEFWPYNFSPGNALGIPGASSATFDFGDQCDSPNGSYGSMQVHVHGDSGYTGTIFAFNYFNNGGVSDLGISNKSSGNPDWTMSFNANAWNNRKLRVYVAP